MQHASESKPALRIAADIELLAPASFARSQLSIAMGRAVTLESEEGLGTIFTLEFPTLDKSELVETA